MRDAKKVIENLQKIANVCALDGAIQTMTVIDDAIKLLKEWEADHILIERARRGEIVLDYPTPEQRKKAEEENHVEI